MKQIFHIAWKDIKIEFTEKSTIVFFLILPLIFTTIIGISLSNAFGDEDPNADHRTPIVIVNEDAGRYSEQLLSFMAESDTTRPVLRNYEETLALVEEERITAYLQIPADFSEKITKTTSVSIILTSTAQTTATRGIEESINFSMGKLNSLISISEETQKLTGMDIENNADDILSLETEILDRLNNPPTKAITTQSATTQTNIPNGFEQSSPGQLVTWVLTTLLGGSEAFVYERNHGTLRRLLITPAKKATVFLGKIAGRLAMGIVQMIILIGFGVLALGVNWGRDYLALAVMLFSFGLAGTAMGIMLAAFAKTVKQASSLTILFSMVMAALGGAWWPLEITPKLYQTAVQVLPSTWAMRGFTDVIVRGQGLSGVLLESGILVGFASLFFLIGIWRLRFE